MSENKSTGAGDLGPTDKAEKEQKTTDRVLLTDGGDRKVVGELPDDGGTGVLGKATGSGTTYGVRGEASSGYGLGTPHDLLLKGLLDTDETDFVVEAGTTNTNRAQNVVMGHAGNSATNTYGVTISGGGEDDGSDPALLHEVTEGYGTIGGGRNNTVDGFLGTVGGGGNNAANGRATVGGGNNNTAPGEESTIAGGQANSAIADLSTIGGGGGIDSENSVGVGNTASGTAATVSGGQDNVAGAQYATVGGGGGYDSQAGESLSNEAQATGATVSGGQNNTADGDHATVGGGEDNNASGQGATVAGGIDNEATGTWSTVVGGIGNRTFSGADRSFAAGSIAWAEHGGAFIYSDVTENSDGQNIPFKTSTGGGGPTGEDTFQVRATGGVRFATSVVTDASANNTGEVDAGMYLSSGGSSWQAVSTRTAKHDITPVNPQEVLNKLEDVEVSTWKYDSQADEGITHMGPMAGEFSGAFGLGNDPETIGHVDADGVAFAAIQGLSEKLEEKTERVEEQQDRIEDQAARIEALEEQNRKLEERLTALETQSATGGPVGADD